MSIDYYNQHADSFVEGTLSVDVVDARRNHMVWTGDAIGRVVRKGPAERLDETETAIREIFARYPYLAGSNAVMPSGSR